MACLFIIIFNELYNKNYEKVFAPKKLYDKKKASYRAFLQSY